MIIFYAKASDGSYYQCRFKTWIDVNYALLSLCWGMSEMGNTFEIISKKEFIAMKNSNEFTYMPMALSPKGTNRISGYCIEYLPISNGKSK